MPFSAGSRARTALNSCRRYAQDRSFERARRLQAALRLDCTRRGRSRETGRQAPNEPGGGSASEVEVAETTFKLGAGRTGMRCIQLGGCQESHWHKLTTTS